ncbi:acyltransferase family protein [Thalassotalea sp. M1531]|uniref:Acyltransferase family protein n=1 Tax=Thalassotalea algicola TaxID=2716224 RepID=A0A7Y0L9F6_9GAMM|nr:acyltransferase family protein [Thalassotalea algicola]NMP30390.1 acyltransferase family protein [Thalassotalea algicola]
MLYNVISKLQRYFVFYPPDSHLATTRRVDLDWLRIGLFALLIIHHIGMFYVSNWGWHAKSQYQFEWLESVLLIVEPWRMPAIWLISGIAIRFILAKVSVYRLIALRSLRLLLPLLFGVLIVIPPQLYVEMSAKGEITMSYWTFMQAFYSNNSGIFENYQYGIWPHIDVNHLWYLRSLWFYSLALVALLPLLNSQWLNRVIDWVVAQHGIVLISLVVFIVLSIQLSWPTDQTRYPLGFAFLVLGYLLGWRQDVWQKLSTHLPMLSIYFVIGTCTFIAFYNVVWLDVIKGYKVDERLQLIGMVVYSTMRVIGVAFVLAIAGRFFNKPSKHLAYFSDAVYPFYILHQTLILVFGFYLTQFKLPALIEAAGVSLLTILGCFALFEVIKRVELLRPCFGLKLQKKYSPMTNKFGYAVGLLMISPLAWQLLM